MNTNKVIIGVVIVIALLLVYVFTMSDNSQKEQAGVMEGTNEAMMKGDDAMMESDTHMEGDEVMEADDAMMKDDDHVMDMSKGTYEAYSAEKLSWAEGDGKVVLFFKASWCPTCRALDAALKANLQDIPAGVTILEVDYDNSADLKKKYGVTTQHTLVQVDAKGEMITKWSGGNTLESVVAKLK